jgi:hypothetical protein
MPTLPMTPTIRGSVVSQSMPTPGLPSKQQYPARVSHRPDVAAGGFWYRVCRRRIVGIGDPGHASGSVGNLAVALGVGLGFGWTLCVPPGPGNGSPIAGHAPGSRRFHGSPKS